MISSTLAGQRADAPVLHHALGAVTQGHREILTAAGLDLLHNLLGKAQAVFQASAVLVGDAPVLHHALGAVTQGHREILTAAGLDLLHNLLGKAQAVFQASAVLVGTVVEQSNGELVDQVALMHRVDLHTIETGTLGVVGAIAKLLHDGVDLLHGEGAAGLIQPAVRNRGRQVLFSQRCGMAEGATGGNSPRLVGMVTRPNPPDSCKNTFAP